MPSNENLLSGVASPVKVLAVGGSYAGLGAALDILDLCSGKVARMGRGDAPNPAHKINLQVTVVDERDGYYHLIGTPLAFSSKEYYQKAWSKFSECPTLQRPDLRFIQGSITNLDCAAKVATITEHETRTERQESYDYFVAASGLRRAWPTVPQALNKEDFLKEATTAIEAAEKAREGVVVIGGGAVGVEMAGEIKVNFPEQKVTLIHSRNELLSSEPLPDEFKERALRELRAEGVNVILNDRVLETHPVGTDDGSALYRLRLKDNSHILAGHVISAISHPVPTSSYIPKAALDSENYVKIRPSLQFEEGTVPNADVHFAAGDIAAWSGIRRCGGAFHMGTHVAANIYQLILQSQKLQEKVQFKQLAKFESRIALAVGKSTVCYGPENGVSSGENMTEIMFGKDLGWTICWNHMQLAKAYEP